MIKFLLGVVVILGGVFYYTHPLKEKIIVVSPSIPMGVYQFTDHVVKPYDYANLTLSQDQFNQLARRFNGFSLRHFSKFVVATANQQVCFDGETVENKTTGDWFYAQPSPAVVKEFKLKTGCYEIPDNHVFALTQTENAIDSRVLGAFEVSQDNALSNIYQFEGWLKDWMAWYTNPDIITLFIIKLKMDLKD